ncbi:MAG: right-handed parallel beta-helix repeat-containing protein, partial [Bacteroidales bacterium]|nr:right-handed parallel beta-helix repeat-containing protein [Bacteroidales bacterium]
DTIMEVVVDTFTVLYPTDYYAEPFGNFSFDILNGKIEQVDADLYVSQFGDNTNSGLTEEDPLKTLRYAFSIIMADSLHQNTIHLLEGTYSLSTSEELFPIYMVDYISLSGESESSVILDAEGLSTVIEYHNNHITTLSDLTLTGGNSSGIFITNSDLDIQNVTLSNNNGHGIYCHNSSPYLTNVQISENAGRGLICDSDSNPNLENVSIVNNSGGGISCSNSSPYLENVFITENYSSGWGGGINCNSYSSPVLKNVQITGNTANDNGGGIACYVDCFPILINVTLTNNTSNDVGGAIYAYVSSSPSLMNSVLWNNSPHEIFGNSTNITYSDIQGGWEGEGNIDENPSFIGSGNYPYSLSDESPCVNAGTPDTTGLNLPAFDLAGNLRIYGGRIDMGAYENQNVSTFVTKNKLTNNFDVRCNPNPFFDEMNITWYQVESSCTKIEIWNSTGKIVKELFNNFLSKGKHIYKWNSNELPSGIYYIQLNVDDDTITRKVVKL